FLVQIFQLPLDSLKHLERSEDVAVPEVPLDPLQLVVQLPQVAIRSGCNQLLELLPLPRDTHRDVKPVEQMLCQRPQIQLPVTEVVAAIGEERDGLVHLKPLRLEQLGQPTLPFGVVAGHKAKALGTAIGRHALADDQLESAGLAIVAVPSVDVATVNADGQRARGPRQRIPIALTALHEARLLIAETSLKPLGHLLSM